MEIATIICPANPTGLSKLWPDVSMPLFSQLCNQRGTVVFWQVCVINAAEIKPTNSPQLCSEDLVVDKLVKKHRGDGVTSCYHNHWSHLFFLKLNPPKIVFVHLHKQKVLHKFYEKSLISFHFASKDQDLFLWYCCFFTHFQYSAYIQPFAREYVKPFNNDLRLIQTY